MSFFQQVLLRHTKQALERWSQVSKAEQKRLREELATREPGTACIELDEPATQWPEHTTAVKARIVTITFGADITQDNKRYLFRNELPSE